MTDARYTNELLELLGIEKPIIQAPMAGVSTPSLAAAVSNAGGLGSLGVGAMNADGARSAIAQTRALTGKPFNINLFCHAPAVSDTERERQWLDWLAPRFAEFGVTPPAALKEIYTSFVVDADMLDMLLRERPAVVSFHFGLPSPEAIAALRDAGIVLLGNATSVAEARAIADAGLGTMALTRLLVRQFKLPVIAAGGIMDGAGIAAALALGAQAAQLGTAFVACPETSIDEGYRRALLGEPAHHTTFTSAISGRVARSMVNRFTELGEAPDSPPVPDYPIAYDAGKALHAAAKAKGEFGYGAQWGGQAAALARSLPAAALVERLFDETREATASLRI